MLNVVLGVSCNTLGPVSICRPAPRLSNGERPAAGQYAPTDVSDQMTKALMPPAVPLSAFGWEDISCDCGRPLVVTDVSEVIAPSMTWKYVPWTIIEAHCGQSCCCKFLFQKNGRMGKKGVTHG